MKKLLVLLVLLGVMIGTGYSIDPTYRELSLANTILADNYAFTLYPSLLPQEDSQLWLNFAGGNYSEAAIFCKKSELFNFYIVHDNSGTAVSIPAVLNALFTSANGVINFTYPGSAFHSPLNIGYAAALGNLSVGILLDYQTFNNSLTTYTAATTNTNILDVKNNMFDLRPSVSVDLGVAKLDVAVPVRLNFLKYVDTVDGPTVTNSVTMTTPFLDTVGIEARGVMNISDMIDLGVHVLYSKQNTASSIIQNIAGVSTETTLWGGNISTFTGSVGFSCKPSEKISIYGDVTYGKVSTDNGTSVVYVDGTLNSMISNNKTYTTTLLPTMNFGVEINLGKFKPRFGFINAYTESGTYNKVTKSTTATQNAPTQAYTAGLGIELGDFTIDGLLAVGGASLLAAINNPFMIPSTIMGGGAGNITSVFSTVEVNYRF